MFYTVLILRAIFLLRQINKCCFQFFSVLTYVRYFIKILSYLSWLYQYYYYFFSPNKIYYFLFEILIQLQICIFEKMGLVGVLFPIWQLEMGVFSSVILQKIEKRKLNLFDQISPYVRLKKAKSYMIHVINFKLLIFLFYVCLFTGMYTFKKEFDFLK